MLDVNKLRTNNYSIVDTDIIVNRNLVISEDASDEELVKLTEEYNKLSPTARMFSWYTKVCEECDITPVTMNVFYDNLISWHNDKCFAMIESNISPHGVIRFGIDDDNSINMFMSYLKDNYLAVKFNTLSMDELRELFDGSDVQE